MKKRTKPIFNGAELITSLIYLCSISTALMYVLCKSYAFVCSLIMTAVCFGIFWVFYKLRLKKILSLLTFIGLLVLVNVVCNAVGGGGYGEGSFMRFLFTSSDFFNPFYAGAAILLFSLIIGFSASYFTVYLPRPSFLLLPAFIPLILAARTAGGLPAGIIIFMAAGFFLASMGLARPENPENEVYIHDTKARYERLIAMGALGLAAALLLMIVPKVQTTRYGQLVDSVLFKPQNRNYFGTQRLSSFQERSLPNTGNNTPGTNVLFTVVTNAPVNVSKASFDVYEGEDGWLWTTDEESVMGYPNWEDSRRTLNYSLLLTKLKRGVSQGKLDKYKSELESIPDSRTYAASMTVRIADGSDSQVILHPQRTYGVTVSDHDAAVYRNSKDEMFTGRSFGANGSYFINYFVEAPNSEFIDMIERVGLEVLLLDAVNENVITGADYSAFIEESSYASMYHSILPKYGASDIEELAKEITEGLSNDYEKALAIERWFGEEDFLYDLDFVPDEATAEYFLFKSKRGICTDFATASVLLLRAAGIPARYTEGFVMPESIKDNYGRYAVTAAQAHAYAEAFIDGYGWLIVDGTRYADVGSSAEEAMRTAAVIIVVVIVVFGTLALIFRRQLSEFFFAAGLAFKNKNGRIRSIYLRTRKLACAISERNPKTTTAEEVLDIITRTLYKEAEAREITDAANDLMYGSGSPDVDERQLYRDYTVIRKMKRSQKR